MLGGVEFKNSVFIRLKIAGFVVCGDKNECFGVIEGKLHKSTNSLIESKNSLECFCSTIAMRMLVNIRFLVHKEEAVFIA